MKLLLGHSPEPGVPMLRTINLTKQFGTITAVDHLDIEVHAGEVFGFLGPNGSGKSTTVGMILGLIHPTGGRIELFGEDTQQDYLRRRVGAIVEAPAFYPYLSGRDNLRALAIAAGGVPESRIAELLDLVGLTERAHSPYRTYSLGMKQRLGLAFTLLTEPSLIILDEPTNGLDPAGQREIRELIPRLASEGRAVLVASHLLHEVEQICDRVAIIRRGKLLRSGTVAELLRGGNYLDLEVPDPNRAVDVLRPVPFIENLTVNGRRLQVTAPADSAAEVNRLLADAGIYASELVRRSTSLEDVFLDVTADGATDAEERTESNARHVA